jgi:tetratricopeptide (TPR) repeat protein
MYFENQTGDAELEWMREGLTDMLITNLSRSNKISVLSRRQMQLLLEKSGFQTDAEIPFEQIIGVARKSRAENFITGSYARAGEKVRIEFQLHDTNAGALLAAESLIVEKPEQILTEIDLISVKLSKYLTAEEPENPVNLADVMTDNLEAYRYYSLAMEKAQALQSKQAIELLEKSVALDPQFAMAHARIGYVYSISWGYAEKGKAYLEKAFKLSERLSEKDRLNIKAWYEIADLDFPSAIQTYREIISKYPLEIESYNRLGRLLEGEDRLEEAVEVLKQGLTIDPEGKDIYNTLGGVYSELGRHSEAIAARSRYVALAPAEANAYDSLGLAYQWAGDYDRAIVNYNRALELNPNFEIALVHLANTRFQMGQYRAAENLFRRYIEIAPSEGEKARGWNCIAAIRLKKRDFAAAEKAAAEALKAYKDANWFAYIAAVENGSPAKAEKLKARVLEKIKTNERGARPNQRFDFFMRGYIALKKGRNEEAIAFFQEALKRKPPIWNIEAFEDALANAYFQIGNLDEAVSQYQRILQLNPKYPLARFYLAQTLEQKGLREEARAEYLNFLQIWEQADEDIPEIITARKFVNLS